MSKKTAAITLVLVTGLIAGCGSDEDGRYTQKNDTFIHHERGGFGRSAGEHGVSGEAHGAGE